MNKGYIVNESLDLVKARVEKLMANAKGAFFNECFNSARGTLDDGNYAQFGWMAKEDGTTVITIEARSASAIENIYAKLYAPAPVVEPEAAAEAEVKTEE